VGFNREFPFGVTVPFIWTEATGMMNLNNFVAAQGIDTGGLDLALVLTGTLLDGTPFEAIDCIRIVPGGMGLLQELGLQVMP
jgi:hypothetical protein